MKLNWKFDLKWSPELKSTLVNSAAGSVLGVANAFLQKGAFSSLLNGKTSLLAMIAISYGFGMLLQRITTWQPKVAKEGGIEKYEIKWWLGNGFYPFFLFWAFCWILFYNLI